MCLDLGQEEYPKVWSLPLIKFVTLRRMGRLERLGSLGRLGKVGKLWMLGKIGNNVHQVIFLITGGVKALKLCISKAIW